jgi:hypothetical protein
MAIAAMTWIKPGDAKLPGDRSTSAEDMSAQHQPGMPLSQAGVSVLHSGKTLLHGLQ